MIPRASESLSFLMGAQAISDEELTRLGVEIVQRIGSGIRGLLIPDRSVQAYRELIRLKLTAGFWNETVGRSEIFFQFKLDDGTLEEFAYSAANREEIARIPGSMSCGLTRPFRRGASKRTEVRPERTDAGFANASEPKASRARAWRVG